MHYKGFNVLIECRFSEFLLIDNFHLLDDRQSLGGGVRPLNKFFLGKFDVYIAEGEEKYP